VHMHAWGSGFRLHGWKEDYTRQSQPPARGALGYMIVLIHLNNARISSLLIVALCCCCCCCCFSPPPTPLLLLGFLSPPPPPPTVPPLFMAILDDAEGPLALSRTVNGSSSSAALVDADVDVGDVTTELVSSFLLIK